MDVKSSKIKRITNIICVSYVIIIFAFIVVTIYELLNSIIPSNYYIACNLIIIFWIFLIYLTNKTIKPK